MLVLTLDHEIVAAINGELLWRLQRDGVQHMTITLLAYEGLLFHPGGASRLKVDQMFSVEVRRMQVLSISQGDIAAVIQVVRVGAKKLRLGFEVPACVKIDRVNKDGVAPGDGTERCSVTNSCG